MSEHDEATRHILMLGHIKNVQDKLAEIQAKINYSQWERQTPNMKAAILVSEEMMRMVEGMRTSLNWLSLHL